MTNIQCHGYSINDEYLMSKLNITYYLRDGHIVMDVTNI